MSTLCATVPLTFGQIDRLPYRERQQAYDKMLAPLRRYEAERWAREHSHTKHSVNHLRYNQASTPRQTIELKTPVVSIPAHTCAFCTKPYDSLRSNSLYCSTLCRVKSFQHRKNPSMRSSRGRPKIMY